MDGTGKRAQEGNRALLMKILRFNTDQMILILVICLVIAGLSLWRLFNLY